MGMARAVTRCPSCGIETVEPARFCPGCGQSLVSRLEVQERRRVTALFADLVASTSMGEQLDPEVVRGYVARFFERATTEVQRRGGSVEKFSGDAALALFGLQVAHEDDPERAVRAALAIHAGLAEIAVDARERHAVDLRARIGIESGEVVVGDPFGGATMATGDPLNLAARLEQRARPGETIVGPHVHEATARAIRCEPAGEWELAGKRAAVPTWRVVCAVGEIGGERDREPGRLSAPLTGRDEELSLMLGTAARAAAERKTVLFTVLGVPGIGKSRLVREATDRLSAGGWHVLEGRCLPYGDGITYWPIAEIVREAAGIDEGQDAAVALDRLRTAVHGRDAADRLAFAIGLSSVAQVTGEAMDAEIAWAVQQLAVQLAESRPAAIVFEDIHWAEPPLLDLIEHLATWARESPLMLICLARPEIFDRRPTWGAGRMEATRITLEPLTRAESADLLRGLLGAPDLVAGVAGQVLDISEGNPLFAEEMVRMLIDRRQIARRGGRWETVGDPGRLALPESVEGLIRARLDSVPREERAMLQCASVIGRSFPAAAIARLTGADVTRTLDDAILRDLLAPEAGAERAYQFRHILIRDVAYESLPKARRSELHGAVVDWLLDWAGDRREEFLEIEAYHREQAILLARELEGRADAAGVAEAVATLERCARKAARRDDWRSVVRWADRALALHPEPAERHAELDALLLDGLLLLDEHRRAKEVGEHLRGEAEAVGRRDLRGWALHAVAAERWISLGAAGGLAAGAELLEEARRDLEAAGDREHLVRVLRTLADEREALGQLEAAVAGYREIAALGRAAGDPGVEAQALLKAYGALMFLGRAEEAQPMLEAAAALADGVSRLTRASIWWARGLAAYWYGGDPAGGVALVRKALAVFSEAGSLWREEAVLEHLVWVERNEGHRREAIELGERQLAIVQAMGNVGRIPTAASWLAINHLERRNLAAAERYADLARSVVADDDLPAMATTKLALGRVRDRQGRDAEAEQILSEALAAMERTQLRTEAAYFYEALAAFHLRRARWDEGERLAGTAERVFLATFGERSPALPPLRRRLAAARAAGRAALRVAARAGGHGRPGR
jgi:class 3 adenylate cyclase/tetratricopeptide (TPR) repeat protein